MFRRFVFVLALSLVATGALPSFAEEEATANWSKDRTNARSLFEQPGFLRKKEVVVEKVARDNSERAAELLVTWAIRSTKFREKVLLGVQAEAREKYTKVEKLLLKAYKVASLPAPTMKREHLNTFKQHKAARDKADADVQAELLLQKRIGSGIQSITDPAGIRWLASDGLRKLQKADGVNEPLKSLALALLQSKLDDVLPLALKLADPKGTPSTVAAIIGWISENEPEGGFEVVVNALRSPHPAVQRAAVWALHHFNDVRAVKPLIDILDKTEGLIPEEIEEVLHWFTGQSFNADANVWKRWWKDAGEAWAAKAGARRHAARTKSHSGTTTKTTFYDIPTESHRIVFVLDRSGSMKTKAGDKTKERSKEEPKPKGPITGGGKRKKKKKDGPVGLVDGPVAGTTKMEVAKNHLARSIRSLDKDVNFNLVFYSSDVQVWQPAPDLRPATPPNKKAAEAWFMGLDANGNTALFAALQRALAYAEAAVGGKKGKKIKGGADTIFLLSDGSPTGNDGKPLANNIVEQQYQAFKKANEKTRCIVHTIGIGPGHSRGLMMRIARESGGEYRAVGVD